MSWKTEKMKIKDKGNVLLCTDLLGLYCLNYIDNFTVKSSLQVLQNRSFVHLPGQDYGGVNV